MKKKSGWTGRDYQRIYFSAQKEDGTYGNPGNYSKKLNDLNKHCGPVSFSEDGKMVVFTRTGETSGKNDTYNIQLYIAESLDGKKWKNVKVLPFCSRDFNYMHPALSPDGTKLFFVSDKRGGLGGTDIYLSKRNGDRWSKPQNLGPVINTPANEAFPFYHKSNKLFFSSKGHLSYGGFDILFSNLKDNETWQKPVNVGKPINSSYDDISMYLDESLESGMFASARNGGDDDIYIFKIMEGINAELESLDFEGLVDYERPEREEEYIGEEESSATKTNVASVNEEIKKEVEERPIKNMEGAIRNDNSLEEIREEKTPEIASVIPDATEAKTETTPEILEEKINEAAPVSNDIVEEVLIEAPPVEEQSIDIMDAPPMEEKTEEIAVVEEMSNRKTFIEETSSDLNPVREEVINESVTEKVEKESIPKQRRSINLIIPSKKKKERPVKESSIETPVEVVERNEELVVEEEPIESTFPGGNSIMDQEPMETKPPVMLGDESSMLSLEVEKLPMLAEKLQAGQAVSGKGFIIEGLNYSKGSYLLSPKDTRSLSGVIDLMNLYPELKIEIGSHTSSRGNDIDNHNLTRKRAMSIMAFLVYKGISNDRITAKGYGETRLLNRCANGVDCSRAEHDENDRVEVKVIK